MGFPKFNQPAPPPDYEAMNLLRGTTCYVPADAMIVSAKNHVESYVIPQPKRFLAYGIVVLLALIIALFAVYLTVN